MLSVYRTHPSHTDGPWVFLVHKAGMHPPVNTKELLGSVLVLGMQQPRPIRPLRLGVPKANEAVWVKDFEPDELKGRPLKAINFWLIFFSFCPPYIAPSLL